MDIGTLTASVTSSIISRIICYPLDTIAVQHTSSNRRPLLSVPIRNYYRGLPVSLMIVTPAMSLYLCTYRQSKEYLQPYFGDSTATYVSSGIIAEITSSLLWTPLEVIKARLQISKTELEGKLGYNLRSIWRNEGIRGFYRGYFMGLAIFIPYNAIWWGVYENVKKTRFLAESAVPVQAALSSALAVTASAGFIHPLDLVKTRYQVATSETVSGKVLAGVGGSLGGGDREGVRQIIKNVRREGGWFGFYRGFFPRLACSVPSGLIMMSALEYLKPDESMKEKVLDAETVV